MTQTAETLHSAASIRAERRRSLRDRYGGLYWGSDFIGFAVALVFTAIFLAIVGAIIGGVGHQLGAALPKAGASLHGVQQMLAIGGLIGALIAVFLGYVVGGYTAGRMARFDGAQNGVGVVAWTVLVAIVLAGLDAAFGRDRFNLSGQLPSNVNGATLTIGVIVAVIVTLVVMLAGASLGGTIGDRYHRKIDRELGAA